MIAGGLLAAPLAAEAQQAAKVPRIGFLAGSLAGGPHLPEAFRQGLRDLGHVEGRTVMIEYRDAEGKSERLPALAAELVALKVDVIVAAAGTLTALTAKQATRTLPIVFIGAGEPVTSGLVTTLARPGGNATGLSSFGPRGSPVPGRHIAYWMTSSARPSTDCGIVRPRALAVLRLITSSNFVGCSTGRSPGLAPFRILST